MRYHNKTFKAGIIASVIILALVLCACGRKDKPKGFDLGLKGTGAYNGNGSVAATSNNNSEFSMDSPCDNDDIYYVPGQCAIFRNNKYYDYFFGPSVTADDVIQTMQNNKEIDDNLKPIAIDFVKTMYDYYGDDLELRLFNENMRTLTVEYKTPSEIAVIGHPLAKYDYELNAIIIPNDADFADEQFQLIFRHELGHAICTYLREDSKTLVKYRYWSEGYGSATNEPLTVVLTTQPFLDRYSEATQQNMGYGLVANVYRIMIDCCEYNVVDGTRQNINGFREKLSEVLPEGISQEEFLRCFDVLYKACLTPNIEPPKEDLDTFYTTLTQMYIDKYVTDNMNRAEINSIRNTMKSIIRRGTTLEELYGYDIVDREFDKITG